MVLEENGENKIEKLTNEQVLDRIGEKRTLLNNNISRKVNELVKFGDEIASFMMEL